VAEQEGAFDVYGYRFAVRGDSGPAVEGVRHDFAFFRSPPAGGEFTIELCEQEPDFEGLPDCPASVYTPRNVAYRDGRRTYFDYHGEGLGILDRHERSFRVISTRRHLLYEAAYLFLLSDIGQHLDRRRMHRIHALAMSLNGRAILVLLPMGGGKSTLGAYLLRRPELQILSDDSPFVDSRGGLHAFPLHLGLLSGAEEEIPAEHRRMVDRMEFGPKFLINYEYFAHRVRPSAEPGIVLLGSRILSADCRIEPAGMLAGLRAMVAASVIGLGLFHGLEFVLESSPWELLSKFSLASSRLRNCVQLLRRSEIRRLRLGRDPERNARTVAEYASKLLQ